MGCRAEKQLVDRDLRIAEKDKAIDALKACVGRLNEEARLRKCREAGRARCAGSASSLDDLDTLCQRSAQLLCQVSGAVAEGERREARAGLRRPSAQPTRTRCAVSAEPSGPRL